MQRESASLPPKRKMTMVLVEDVSDSEEDSYDTSVILDTTVRNRRPSPGQWLEPVEMMPLIH